MEKFVLIVWQTIPLGDRTSAELATFGIEKC